MSGRTLYIESSAPPETPCACSNCKWRGALDDLDPATDGVLEAGDPSFAGRCPECDSVAYLDRPVDRATDALRHLAWTKAQGYPPGDSNLTGAALALQIALSEALDGASVVIALPQQ